MNGLGSLDERMIGLVFDTNSAFFTSHQSNNPLIHQSI